MLKHLKMNYNIIIKLYYKLKQKLCEEHGIKLIIIPYEYNFTDPQKMKDYIIKSLEM